VQRDVFTQGDGADDIGTVTMPTTLSPFITEAV